MSNCGWPTADLPIGTVITHRADLVVAIRVGNRHDPFPWRTDTGGEFSDEWAARVIDAGATVETP